jgi:Co/Zn/Cd efflux system component
MASALQITSPDAIRRIQRVQTLTIAWMSVEALVSLLAARRARSPALLAFGGDSAIELFSAMVVLWRFRASVEPEHAEKRAARVAGALLFVLAAFVAVTSVTSRWAISNLNQHFSESQFWWQPPPLCRGLRRKSGGCRQPRVVRR